MHQSSSTYHPSTSNATYSGIFVGCTFAGKEKDIETGLSYFGARYYDSELLTGWLSVDPMADKYPSMSPYNYCACNPFRYVDPNGDSLWANKTSQQDLFLLVKNENKRRVSFDENGLLSVDMSGITNMEYDKGLALLNNISTAKEKYLYERSDEISAIMRSEFTAFYDAEGNLSECAYYDCLDENRSMNMALAPHGIINASNGGCDSQTGRPGNQIPVPDLWIPKDGYDGHVIMAKTGTWTIWTLGMRSTSGKDAFISVLFHELSENYFRTTFGLPYHGKTGAHQKAANLEGFSFHNVRAGSIKSFSYQK